MAFLPLSFVPKPPAARSIPTVTRTNGEPVFNLFVIGTRASGKTVLLSALYNQMSVPDLRTNGYYIRLDSDETNERRNYLVRQYNSISNPDSEWPEGDKKKRDYVFRCFIDKPDSDGGFRQFPLFKFNYVDFPGGYVDTPTPEDDFDVNDVIKKAHTIIFLIDGYKVLLRLRSIEHEERTIDYDLNAFCEHIFNCREQQVQFVITKWDLLKHEYSLELVKAVLFQNQRFFNLVGQRSRPTYLLPVSAVGNDFAYFDSEKRAVVKKPGGRALPYNLDVTLAFTITDALLSEFKDKYSGHAILKPFLKIVKLGAAGTGWVLKLSAFLPDEDALTVRALMVAEKVNQKIRDGAIRLDNAIDEKIRKIKDKNTALESVIGIQSNIRADFLSRFSHAEINSSIQGGSML